MNIYTKKQAAEFLQISRPQLDVLINTGYLIPSKLGKRTYRITEQQLMDCIELGQREQNTEFAPTFKWTQKKAPTMQGMGAVQRSERSTVYEFTRFFTPKRKRS